MARTGQYLLKTTKLLASASATIIINDWIVLILESHLDKACILLRAVLGDKNLEKRLK